MTSKLIKDIHVKAHDIQFDNLSNLSLFFNMFYLSYYNYMHTYTQVHLLLFLASLTLVTLTRWAKFISDCHIIHVYTFLFYESFRIINKYAIEA